MFLFPDFVRVTNCFYDFYDNNNNTEYRSIFNNTQCNKRNTAIVVHTAHDVHEAGYLLLVTFTHDGLFLKIITTKFHNVAYNQNNNIDLAVVTVTVLLHSIRVLHYYTLMKYNDLSLNSCFEIFH